MTNKIKKLILKIEFNFFKFEYSICEVIDLEVLNRKMKQKICLIKLYKFVELKLKLKIMYKVAKIENKLEKLN